jgi:hypothetical protein
MNLCLQLYGPARSCTFVLCNFLKKLHHAAKTRPDPTKPAVTHGAQFTYGAHATADAAAKCTPSSGRINGSRTQSIWHARRLQPCQTRLAASGTQQLKTVGQWHTRVTLSDSARGQWHTTVEDCRPMAHTANMLSLCCVAS